MDHNSQEFQKKICILTKTDNAMEEMKPILIKPMVLEYYNMLITDEQRQDFFKELVMCGLGGTEPTTEDPLFKIALKPCLDSIRECRENYNRRQAKNAEYGIQGKEYGILGKEYGILGKEYGILGKKYGKVGGRPRKGETKEQYKERKRLENEALISENKDIYALADEYAKERKEKATKEELEVWDCIKQLGLPNIYFQQPVFISGKHDKPCKFYIADFLDVDNKIDIEIDGGYHTSEEQRMKDEERERDFKKMGYETLRITNDEVNGGKAIERIKWFRDNNIL